MDFSPSPRSADLTARVRLSVPQAEALAWSKGGGGLYASGEFRPAPIFYLSPDR